MSDEFQSALSNRLKGAQAVAVLAIGSHLRADDAAGLLVAEEVQTLLAGRSASSPRFAVYMGETAPENFTGEIKRFAPSHLVLVDAADVGRPAGSVVLLETDVLMGNVSFSTHSLPVKVLVNYLRRFITCDVFIVGIQPATSEFGRPVSPEVAQAAKRVAAMLTCGGQ